MARPRIIDRDDNLRIDLRGIRPTNSKSTIPRSGGKTLGHMLMRGSGTHVPTPAKGSPGAITKVKYMSAGRNTGYAAYMTKDRAEATQGVATYLGLQALSPENLR
jgi:hypothetical protein